MPDDHPSNSAVPPLLYLIGGGLFTQGVGAILREGFATVQWFSPSVLTAAVGLLIIGCGFFWKSIQFRIPINFTEGLNRLAASHRTWLVIVAAIWLYNLVGEVRHDIQIVMLRNDVTSINYVLNRLVLPRHLDKFQQATITSFLLQFEPHEYAFRIIPRDEEASSYSADVNQALTKSGWKRAATNPYIYADDVPEGVSIDFTVTIEHAPKYDQRNPNPGMLLEEAFGLAGVHLNGVSGGAVASITEDRLVISIGRRRMDSFEIISPE